MLVFFNVGWYIVQPEISWRWTTGDGEGWDYSCEGRVSDGFAGMMIRYHRFQVDMLVRD